MRYAMFVELEVSGAPRKFGIKECEVRGPAPHQNPFLKPGQELAVDGEVILGMDESVTIDFEGFEITGHVLMCLANETDIHIWATVDMDSGTFVGGEPSLRLLEVQEALGHSGFRFSGEELSRR